MEFLMPNPQKRYRDFEDFIQQNRLSNIGGPEMQMQNAIPIPTQAAPPIPQIGAVPPVLTQIADAQKPQPQASTFDEYTPETMATDRFNKLLENIPERRSPGIARRIAASGSTFGGGGIKAAEQVMYAPYERELSDWKEKTGPYREAANLERYANANERQVTSSKAANEVAIRRQDEIDRHNRETEAATNTRNRIQQYKVEHPDAKWDL